MPVAWAAPVGLEAFSELQIPVAVEGPHTSSVTRRIELLQRVGPQRMEESIPGLRDRPHPPSRVTC